VDRLVFHLDMDAFFASIEQVDDPSLRGKPVIVGGGADESGRRGVVATCSYEARAFGVRSAMPMLEARRLCPHGIYIGADPDKYVARAKMVFRVLRDFTPMVEPSSVDEAYLDMTATAERFGGALTSGQKIKDAIRERTSLPATIGIAPNKLLAKLMSGHAKPDGLKQLEPHAVRAYIEPLAARELWGIGPKTAEELAALGIHTVGDLGRASRSDLGRRMGVVGERLVLMGQGIDDAPVIPYFEAESPKSMGHERTMSHDLRDWDAVEREVLALADTVGRRVRLEGFAGRTVVAKIRYASFRTVTRQRALAAPTDDERTIFRAARDLVRTEAFAEASSRPREPLRLLGISLTHLVAKDATTRGLFDDADRAARETRVRDAVRDRFGDDALVRARLLLPPGASKNARSGVVPFGAQRRIAETP
jgi:nucleotidyltransferase/DNA polymerase involved in DNA repair